MAQIQNIYAPQTEEQLNKILKDLKKIQEQTLAMSKTSLSIFGTKNASNPQALNNAIEQIDKLNKKIAQQEKAIKRLTNVRAQSNKKTSEEIVNNAVLRKNADNHTKSVSKLAGAYTNLAAKLTIAEKKYRDLKASNSASTTEILKAEKAVLKLRNRVDSINKPIKRFGDQVGNYPTKFRLATASLRSFVGAFGLTSGIFLFASAMRDVFDRVRQFDKAMQNIAGILRSTRKDIKDLETEIKKVASTSVNTSKDVAKLAENLLTLGKTKKEVKQLLSPVNDLSIALETSGAEAAEFLVQNLNAFGASSSEADKYADTIATIRTSTSLNFQRMRDSFQYLTPISRILNKDLAYTGSLIGVLADNGLKAESAGRLLGTAQQKLAKKGKSLQDALNEINEAQEKGVSGLELLTLASGLFGVQAAKVGVILANNSKKLEENAQAIRDNTGALDDLVNQQLESLDAKLKILDSSWEAFILSVDSGKGAIGSFVSSSIESLTRLLNFMQALEDSQTRVTEVTGSKKGFLDYLKMANIFTNQINSENDDLIEKQNEFNRLVDDLDGQKIVAYKDAIHSLTNSMKTNNDMSDNMKKLYLAQIKLLEDIIKSKTSENEVIDDNNDVIVKNSKLLDDNKKKKRENIKETSKLKTEGNEYTESLFKQKNAIEQISELEKLRNVLTREGTREYDDLTAAIKKYEEQLKSTIKVEDLSTDSYLQNRAEKAEADRDAELAQKALEKATMEFIDTVSKSALGDLGLGSLTQFVDGTFDKLFKGAIGLKEQFAVTFSAISDVATEAFGVINQVQQQGFENQLNRLSLQKENSLRFAGEGVEAREEIESQYEARRAAIQKNQAEAEKKQAIFSTILSTSKGVVAALAALNPGLAITIGAIGAAKLALIQSTEVPAFKDGVDDFKGGMAIVGDGGKHEYIKTPDGTITKTPKTDTLVNLPKGSSVLKDDNALHQELNNMLTSNNIMPLSNSMFSNILPNITNNGITKSDLKEVFSSEISKVTKSIKNKESVHIDYNERGMIIYTINQYEKRQRLNSRITGKGNRK